jgi:hypothetical protein
MRQTIPTRTGSVRLAIAGEKKALFETSAGASDGEV